jgi:hypothetical protein
MKKTKWKKKEIAFFSILSLFIVSGLVFGPRITGYTVLKNENNELEEQQIQQQELIASYEENVTMLMKDLDICKETKNDLYNEIDDYINKTVEYKTEINMMSNECENEKLDIENELDDCKEKLSEIKRNYAEIVTYSGNKICCMQKVFNPGIGSFDVDKYKIVCLEGREGENRIFCEALD